MSETFMPRLAAPVGRTNTGAAESPTAGVDQSRLFQDWNPFADEGDE